MEESRPPIESRKLLVSPPPNYEDRLSIPFGIRFPATTGVAFVTGLSLGLSHGSTASGLRFRAENSHRFPTKPTGWYLYHKSKNYHMMLGGVKEGLKMGFKVAFWAGSFFVVEEAVDRLSGNKDFVSTLIAGLSISGGFSAWNRFPLPTAGRTIKAGLFGGLAFGLAQDALGLARGRRLGFESVTEVLNHRCWLFQNRGAWSRAKNKATEAKNNTSLRAL